MWQLNAMPDQDATHGHGALADAAHSIRPNCRSPFLKTTIWSTRLLALRGPQRPMLKTFLPIGTVAIASLHVAED